MFRLIWAGFIWLRSFIRSRHELGLEIVALRQQLVVLKRRTRRAHLRPSDRLFWVLLCRVWPKWSNPLLIVKPDTVVRWHRKAFVSIGAFDLEANGWADRSPGTRFRVPSTPWRMRTRPGALRASTARC